MDDQRVKLSWSYGFGAPSGASATADVAGVTLDSLSPSSNYGFMGPNPTVITEGSSYPFTIGQVQCLLVAHSQPI